MAVYILCVYVVTVVIRETNSRAASKHFDHPHAYSSFLTYVDWSSDLDSFCLPMVSFPLQSTVLYRRSWPAERNNSWRSFSSDGMPETAIGPGLEWKSGRTKGLPTITHLWFNWSICMTWIKETGMYRINQIYLNLLFIQYFCFLSMKVGLYTKHVPGMILWDSKIFHGNLTGWWS